MKDANPSPFTPATREPDGMMAIATTRAAQEIQAQMVIAKRFPRDQDAAFDKIMTACRRPALAEQASYVFPRGNTQVTGPSIRLAEAIAQAWGNIDFGIIELSQRDGESDVMAYACDLESNTRQVKIFTVKHERRVGKGENFRIDKLSDPRDIYEMTANQGARRLRACILGVIPGDIVESAVDQCDKTLADKGKNEPIIDRARRMIAAFKDYGVTLPMIERRLGHKLDAIIEQEIVMLRKIFAALKDGMGKREDYFDMMADAVPASSGTAAAAKDKDTPKEPAKDKPAEKQPEQPAVDNSNPELAPVTGAKPPQQPELTPDEAAQRGRKAGERAKKKEPAAPPAETPPAATPPPTQVTLPGPVPADPAKPATLEQEQSTQEDPDMKLADELLGKINAAGQTEVAVIWWARRNRKWPKSVSSLREVAATNPDELRAIIANWGFIEQEIKG